MPTVSNLGTLCWHFVTANGFQGENGQRATRELCLERLKNTLIPPDAKGKVIGWDVVNEAIDDRNAGRTENLRNSSWSTAVGPDVLTIAFKYAKEADPDAQLYYNDYNIEQGAVANTGKHASSLLLLKRLIAEGAPIDGVGIQGHWHLDTNLADVEQAIKNYAALGLRVAITELDVTATGDNSGAFGVRGGGRSIRRRYEPRYTAAVRNLQRRECDRPCDVLGRERAVLGERSRMRSF